MLRATARSLAWLAFALALLAALFVSLGIGLHELGQALLATPAWLFAVAFATTFANQLIGVARWRTATRWLSPEAPRLEFQDMLEATVWGSLYGQILPMQVSLALGRFWRARDARGSWVVGTTLYEQLFDLLVLSVGAACAVVVLAIKVNATTSAILFFAAVAASCLAMRRIFALGCTIADCVANRGGMWAAHASAMIAPLARAKAAPARVLASMSGWSLLRLPVLALRAVAFVMVFAPSADWTVVAIGYPAIGLASAAPMLPAGLGITEWTWIGLLMLAGAAATGAAIAAVVMRVVNLVALLGVLLLVLALRRVSPGQVAASPTIAA